MPSRPVVVTGPDPFAPGGPGPIPPPQPVNVSGGLPSAPDGVQLFYSSTAVQTTVIQDLGTTLIVAAITGFPILFPAKLLLDWELGPPYQEVAVLTCSPVLIPTGSAYAGYYSCTGVIRGADGTTQSIHSPGAQVNHGVSAADFFQIAPVFNVCAYGADPYSTAYSDAAFAKAFAAAGFWHGKVYIPPGVYLIQYSLDPLCNGTYSSAYIYGAGPASSVIQQVSEVAHGMQIFNPKPQTINNVTIADLRLNGPGVGTGCGIIAAATGGTSGIVQLVLDNLIVYLFPSHGIYTQNTIQSMFTNVQSVNNGGRGFWLYNGTSTSIINCYANTNPNERGFYLQYMLYSGLFGCAADGNAIGYELFDCDNVNFVNCGAEITAAGSSGLDGSSFKINGCTTCSVLGGRALGNAAVGLYFTGNATQCSVYSFTEASVTGSPTASIKVDAGCSVTAVNYVAITAQSFAAGTTSIINNYGYTYLPTGEIGALTVDNLSIFFGLAEHKAGTDTSTTATYTGAVSFTTATAKQVSTVQDAMLYIFVKTSISVTVVVGATSSPVSSIVPATTLPVGTLLTIRVPKAWYVQITCATMADLAISQVTC